MLCLPDWRSDRDDTGLIPTAYFGIRRVLKFVKEEYTPKDIMITELGQGSDLDHVLRGTLKNAEHILEVQIN